VLTLDPKGAGTMYQGIVALESGSIAGLIEHYLATSEQLQSRMVLAARRRRPHRAAPARLERWRTTRRGRA
jgi:redox-regulated HSP33 family molecular chaperone